MKALIIAVSGAAMLTAAPALAQPLGETQVYGTLGYTHIFSDLKNEDSLNALQDDSADLGAIQGRVGARFGRYLGVEGEVATGIKDAKVSVGDVDANVKLKHQVAAYGVGYLPISDKADLFARVGYGSQKIKAEALGVSASADADSWNFGAGGQYFFDGANGVRAEYTRYDLQGNNPNLDTVSVAYVRKF